VNENTHSGERTDPLGIQITNISNVIKLRFSVIHILVNPRKAVKYVAMEKRTVLIQAGDERV
jgi:hypothetical protein